jgi:hypothetical protein
VASQHDRHQPTNRQMASSPSSLSSSETGRAGMEPLRVDQSSALEMTRTGGTLLCMGVPAHTQLGIDLVTYTVGPKFLGVKMIPPGVHYIHYASASLSSGSAPRSGFFLHLQPSQVFPFSIHIIMAQWQHH